MDSRGGWASNRARMVFYLRAGGLPPARFPSEDYDILIKYVYCERPEAFDKLVLDSGRFLSKDENRSDLFLSTKQTDNPKQIGKIAAFRGDFEIRTIFSGLGDGFFDKEFTLVLPEDVHFSEFQSILAKLGYDITDTTAGQGNVTESTRVYYAKSKWLAISVALINVLLVVSFSIINSYREIGIEKMLGYSLAAIWSKRMPRIFS